MKYNINKMQNGGGIPAFTMLQPILVNNASSKRYDYGMEWGSSSSTSSSRGSKSSSSDSDDDSKGQITDKDILSYLKELNGLESDISGIFKELRQFYALRNYGALNTDDLAMKAIQIMHKIKIANNNAKEWQDAYDQSKNKNSFSEFAVTGHDQVYTLNEDGGIELIDVDDYLEDRELYRPLTNSELLSLRAHNAPFNNNILRVVNESTSISEIGKMIKELLVNLGSESESISWYERHTVDRIQQGIKAIQQGLRNGVNIDKDGIEGLFQVTELNENQVDAANFAIRYIEDMLPNNAKTLLKLKLNGDENKIHGLIADLVSSTTSTKHVYKPDKEKDDLSTSSSSSSSSSSGSDNDFKTMNNDLYENIIRGIGGVHGTFKLQDQDGRTIVFEGIRYSDLDVDKSHRMSEYVKLSQFLPERGIIGNSNTTFGEKEIDKNHEASKIVVLNNGNATCVWLPLKPGTEGKIPYLSILQDEKNKKIIDKINVKIRNYEDWSQDFELIKEIKDSDLKDILFSDFTGSINEKSLQPFLLVDAITSDNYIQGLEKSFTTKIDSSSPEFDDYSDILKTALGDEADKYNWWNVLDWGEKNHDHIYKGYICIPIRYDLLGAKHSAGTTVKESDAQELEKLSQIARNRQGLQSSSPDILNRRHE